MVAAIVAGEAAGLAAAYDHYAPALYAYCRSLLSEPADAADAVQDTFVVAAGKLSDLRDPDRLRPWLYAVARNECHRRLRSRGDQAPLEEALDVTDDAADVSAGAERAELRALVRDAATGLGPAEREVVELQLRQGLGSGEVASVLGISRNHAHALLSRARDQLETALGVLVVARAGRQDCPALDTLLKDWDGGLTVLLRQRVSRHIERCPVCSERRRREMVPAMFLGVVPIAALPLATAALPAGLRDQVLRVATGNSPAAAAHRAAGLRTRSGTTVSPSPSIRPKRSGGGTRGRCMSARRRARQPQSRSPSPWWPRRRTTPRVQPGAGPQARLAARVQLPAGRQHPGSAVP